MRRTSLLILWLMSDIVLFIASFVLAYFLRVGWILSSDLPLQKFMISVALSAIPWLCVLITTRAFALTRNQADPRNLAYIIYSSVVGVAFVALCYFFLFQGIFSRMLIIFALVFTTAFTWLWHCIFDQFQRRNLRSSPPAFPTLIVGITRESKKLIALMEKRKSPLCPVAILDGRGAKETEIEGVPVLGKLNKLEDVLQEKKITHMIQCSDIEQSINLLGVCRSHGITYMLLPSVLGIVEKDEKIESIEGRPVTMVTPPQKGWQWFFQ